MNVRTTSTESSTGRRRRRGRAVTAGDLLYARLRVFQNAADRARRIITDALSTADPWAISFSGGKDSTCLLELVREQAPDTVAYFVNSGAEYPETLDFITETTNVIEIEPGMSLLDMYRMTGMYGRDAERPDTHWRKGQITETMIKAPMEWAANEYGTVGNFTGLRAEESADRKSMGEHRRRIWQQANRLWRCEPLMHWTTQDVWAFIASKELDYNMAYDRMAELGLPRKWWRVAPFAGGSAIRLGRWAILKRGWPDLFNRFAAEFPEVRAYV